MDFKGAEILVTIFRFLQKKIVFRCMIQDVELLVVFCF